MIIFATNNEHKLREVRELAGDQLEIAGLKDIGFKVNIPENESTLEGNALAKALFIKERSGLDCFADDTGLEVEALNGRPGVHSARYAGPEGNAKANIRKLLTELHGIQNRRARFRTVIALIKDGRKHLFEGVVEGTILEEKGGKGGFGYDPVFLPDGYLQTFAEMPLELKNEISHRGVAVRKLINFLKHPQ